MNNWGTCHGLHDIAISDKGFLLVGRSGSGKTTLLDAILRSSFRRDGWTLMPPPEIPSTADAIATG
ncbi:MAG: hypothetical protein M1457_07790 [bacterium]|nr:hypothetical protein [bacterium]